MKRSEMVIEIENILDLYFRDIKEEELTRRSEWVLTRIEELGMLPPSTGNLTTNYNDMGICLEYAWEPEDEA